MSLPIAPLRVHIRSCCCRGCTLPTNEHRECVGLHAPTSSGRLHVRSNMPPGVVADCRSQRQRAGLGLLQHGPPSSSHALRRRGERERLPRGTLRGGGAGGGCTLPAAVLAVIERRGNMSRCHHATSPSRRLRAKAARAASGGSTSWKRRHQRRPWIGSASHTHPIGSPPVSLLLVEGCTLLVCGAPGCLCNTVAFITTSGIPGRGMSSPCHTAVLGRPPMPDMSPNAAELGADHGGKSFTQG